MIYRKPAYPEWVAYEPELLPPPALMRQEGITVLEDWFRWAEEWSMLLRAYGRLRHASDVLEIGCGLGRIAFAIRYLLTHGQYTGFEIVRSKVEFLDRSVSPGAPATSGSCGPTWPTRTTTPVAVSLPSPIGSPPTTRRRTSSTPPPC